MPPGNGPRELLTVTGDAATTVDMRPGGRAAGHGVAPVDDEERLTDD